jgi:nucleoside-diphosphate-sugar epimerase
LVTGGAGFIGSHFVLRHRSSYADDHIVVLDKLTYAADQSFLDPIASAITFVHGDIADHACVATIVRDHAIDVIVNFAAESHVDNSISDASPFIHTNIVGVQNLIEVCKEHPDVKLLHISTDEVYGDLDDGDPPYNVGDALTPSSPYAASKAAGELLIIAAIRTHGIHACISRCTNNFGPHQADEKLIPTIIRWDAPNIFDLYNPDEFCGVNDLCDLNWLLGSIRDRQRFFPDVVMDIDKYLNAGVLFFGNEHLFLFKELLDFYIANRESIDSIQGGGKEQTLLNFVLQQNKVNTKKLPPSWNLLSIHRKNMFTNNWQLKVDPTPYFIKYAYIWHFTGFPIEDRVRLMKQTWELVDREYR